MNYILKKQRLQKIFLFNNYFYLTRFINITKLKNINFKKIKFLFFYKQLKKKRFLKKKKYRKLYKIKKIKSFIYFKKIKKISLFFSKINNKISTINLSFFNKRLKNYFLKKKLSNNYFYINNKRHNFFFSSFYSFRNKLKFKYPYHKNFFKLKKDLTLKKKPLSNFYISNISKIRYVKPYYTFKKNNFKYELLLKNNFLRKKKVRSWVKFFKVQEKKYLFFKKKRYFKKKKWYLNKKKQHLTKYLRLRSFLLTTIITRLRFIPEKLLQKTNSKFNYKFRKLYEQYKTHRLTPTILIPEHLIYYDFKNKKRLFLLKKQKKLSDSKFFKFSIRNQATRYKKKIIFRKFKRKDKKLKTLLFLKKKKFLKIYYKKFLFFKSIFLRYYAIKKNTFKRTLNSLHQYKQYKNNYLFPDKKINLLISKLESRLISVVGRLFKINFLIVSKIIDSYGVFVNNKLVTKRSWIIQKGNLIELPLKVYLKYFNFFNVKFFSYDLNWKITLNYIVNYKILAGIFLDYPLFTQLKYPKLHGFKKKFIRFFINFIK